MNATTQHAIPDTPGTPFGGGFYVGRFITNGIEHALIIAPQQPGHHTQTPWGTYGQHIDGANSFNDGYANTEAMAAAESHLAQWARSLDIDGHTDWYIPSRDELELIYRYLKPTEEENYTWRHGENPSAVPPTHQYTEQLPAQTEAAEFKTGHAQALEDAWYWSSTQYSPNYAWVQLFGGGFQGHVLKANDRRAVAVRRVVSPLAI